MPKIQLLPCPFCGTHVTGRDILPQLDPGGHNQSCYLIRCWQCGASVFEVTRFKSQIAAKWNRRPTIPICMSYKDALEHITQSPMAVMNYTRH